MLLEPSQLENGYQKRFLNNSKLLLLKNLPAWLFYISIILIISSFIFLFLDYAFKELGIHYKIMLFADFTIKMLFGCFSIFLGLEFAANIDFGTFSFKKILDYINISLRNTINYIKFNITHILFLGIILLIIVNLFDINFKTESTNSLFQLMLIVFYKTNTVFFWGFLTVGVKESYYFYPIKRMFELNNYESKLLSQKGIRKNPEFAFLLTGIIPILILMLPFFTFVFLLPITIPFVSLLLYVSFREIFLNKKENEKEEIKVPNFNPVLDV